MVPWTSSFIIEEGHVKNLTCMTYETRPQTNISWYLDGTSVNASGATIDYDIDSDKYTTTSAVNVLGTADKGDHKTLTCLVKDEEGIRPVLSNTTALRFFCKDVLSY